MTLFALGFVLTIKTLPTGTEMLGSSTEGSTIASSPSALLVIGFVASLAGLGLATIVPAIMFMRARRAKA